MELLLVCLQFNVLAVRSHHSEAEREQAYKFFNNRDLDYDAIILSARLSGVAANLQGACNDMIFFDLLSRLSLHHPCP